MLWTHLWPDCWTDLVTVGAAELELLVNILNKELLLVLSGHSVPQRCMPDLVAFKVERVCMCASLVLPLCSVSAFTARSLQRLLENFASWAQVRDETTWLAVSCREGRKLLLVLNVCMCVSVLVYCLECSCQIAADKCSSKWGGRLLALCICCSHPLQQFCYVKMFDFDIQYTDMNKQLLKLGLEGLSGKDYN